MSKKNINWLVPAEAADAFDQLAAGRFGGKGKWKAAAAAMLMYVNANEAERQKLAEIVAIAEATGDWSKLFPPPGTKGGEPFVVPDHWHKQVARKAAAKAAPKAHGHAMPGGAKKTKKTREKRG